MGKTIRPINVLSNSTLRTCALTLRDGKVTVEPLMSLSLLNLRLRFNLFKNFRFFFQIRLGERVTTDSESAAYKFSFYICNSSFFNSLY
jgi:hypothetical protein